MPDLFWICNSFSYWFWPGSLLVLADWCSAGMDWSFDRLKLELMSDIALGAEAQWQWHNLHILLHILLVIIRRNICKKKQKHFLHFKRCGCFKLAKTHTNWISLMLLLQEIKSTRLISCPACVTLSYWNIHFQPGWNSPCRRERVVCGWLD